MDASLSTEEFMMGKGRILVIDDENIVRNVAQRMLRKLEYECEVVNDGNSAIAAYAKAAQSQKPYDVVIIDLKLTGSLDGSQTFKKLEALNPQIKAIVSSGYTFDPVIINYHKHGFQGVVKKPYRIDDLAATLSEIIS
ncbi:MAG: response regulator [bacterium]